MTQHRHDFVNQFDCSQIAFGLDRELDEQSLHAYLQKFSDDDLMAVLLGRLSDQEISDSVDFVMRLLKRHLSEDEYHRLFLKDEDHHH